MTDDEVYRLATGQEPGYDPVDDRELDSHGLPVLSDEEVITFLSEYLDPLRVAMWEMRAEPLSGVHPGGGWVTVEAVQLPDGQALAVAYSLGHPDPDEMLNWKKVWRGVFGPAPVGEVVRYASDWAERTH